MEITEKEFAVIREIDNHQRSTQRRIAKKVGISLGLTNLIIKRLIKKGLIKIKEVPPKTIQYILSPKGFVEKAKKSYYFALRTINSIKIIKENLQDIIMKIYNQGAKEFTIFGNGEITTLTEIAFRDLNLKDINYSRVENKTNVKRPMCSLLFKKNDKKEEKINILLELSKRGVFY